MLKLSNITLVCVTDIDREGAWNALEKSSEGIEWGATLLLQPQLGSIDAWNKFIIYDLHRYIATDYCILIHPDGYITNAGKWNSEWLSYDYIGAPWPMPSDEYSYRSPSGEIIRVGNSVSLRSKRLLELPSKLNFEWKPYFGNTNEDGFLCVHNRDILKEHGIKFAPLEVAKYFSKEHEIPENQGIATFAFHTVDT